MRALRRVRLLAVAGALSLALAGVGDRTQAAAAVFPAERAFAHLQALCALGPRNPGSAGQQKALEYIRRTLEQNGARVTMQSFTHQAPGLPGPVELTNVIGRFGPERPGGFLLGAHWDSRPWADQDPDSSSRKLPVLGANDGGSGTAVLLTLAELFREQPPEMPVLLAFFDGEDLGREGHPEEYLAGSRYMADHLAPPLPEAGLVLDMVASCSMSLAVEETARRLHPDLAALVDQQAAELGLVSYRADWGPQIVDDHIPFLESGLPVLLLIDSRDPFWHTHRDVLANCCPQSLGETGNLVLRILAGGYFR